MVNRDGVEKRMGLERRKYPSEQRIEAGRRNWRREKVILRFGVVVDELFGSGAKRSDRVPVRRRATVDVSAMMATWVEGLPAGGGRSEG